MKMFKKCIRYTARDSCVLYVIRDSLVQIFPLDMKMFKKCIRSLTRSYFFRNFTNFRIWQTTSPLRNASLFSIWTSKVVNMYVNMKCIPKDNLHVMVPFDRHPHTNTMEGDGWRRTATGALQEHSLSELMLSACRFWVHYSSGCYTAGYKSVSERSCYRPSQHRFFLISLGPRANAEMVPAFPSCLHMLFL